MICELLYHTRQGYFKHLKALPAKQLHDEIAVSKVITIRQTQTKTGGRKLKIMMFNDDGFVIGRDHLFDLLREKGLLIKVKHSFKSCTDYKHKLPIFFNLLTDLPITKINQVFVSDITYLRTYNGFVYLYLITDYCSRRIVGYYVSSDLKTESAMKALRRVKSIVPSTNMAIHHSDHGIQYCSVKYQALLAEFKMVPSMTGKNHCYDNAVAERINGILKNEYGLKRMFPDIKVAREAVADAIRIYNEERLHTSLSFKTPASVYELGILAEATQQQSELQVGASA
jgi:transposase InsO family protein